MIKIKGDRNMKGQYLLITESFSENEKATIREFVNTWDIINIDEYKNTDDKAVCLLKKDDIPKIKNIASIGIGMDFSINSDYICEELDALSDEYIELVYCRFNRLPYKVLITERTYLREMCETDLESLYELYSYDGMTDFVEPLYERDKELEFTKNYIDNMYRFFNYGLWLVFRKEDDRLIGRIGLENREIDGKNEVELGYMIGTIFQRQGYAYECCSEVLKYAFDKNKLGIERIMLCTDPANTASAQLAKKLGFKMYCEASITGSLDIYCKSNT